MIQAGDVPEPGDVDVEVERLGAVPVHGEDRERPVAVVPDRRRLESGHAAVSLRLDPRRVELDAQDDAAARDRGRRRERMEDRLAPGRTARLRPDRGDRVHELGEAGDLHAVRVPEQRDEQRADDNGVRERVGVLDQPRMLRPRPIGLVVEAGEVPDVPLVEGQAELLVAARLRARVVAGRDDAPDEGQHVDRAREEAVDVRLLGVVVGVERDVVDGVVALLEHLRLPRAEGRHRAAGAPAGDELDGRVDELHRLSRLRGEAAVLGGRLLADLPGPVHLVAEAPERDAVRRSVPVRRAQVGARRSTRVVAVLDEGACLVDAARAEVDGQHRLDAGERRPAEELVRPELVRLDRPPREVEPDGPLRARADPVLPVVAGDEVPAGVADGGDAELADEREDVAAEAVVVRRRMARLVDPGVDAAAEVLDEAAEDAIVDGPDGEAWVDGEAGRAHPATLHERTGGSRAS